MKSTVLITTLIVALIGNHRETTEKSQTYTQFREGAEWSLTTTCVETTGPHGWACELVRFTVRRNGKFVHCESGLDGGRVAGLKFSFGGRSFFGVEDLLPEAGVGWIISVCACAGNTWSARVCVITPAHRSLETYVAHTLVAKEHLEQRAASQRVEISGMYQEWGGGGTSTSVYVPFRMTVDPVRRLVRAPLPDDPNACAPGNEDIGFDGVFIAGLREGNPSLMRQSLDAWFTEPGADEVRLVGGLGLPRDRVRLEQMILHAEAIATARAALNALAPDITLGDPLEPAIE